MAGWKFKTDFRSMRLDVHRYRRVLLNTLRDLNERAGRAWIHEAVDTTPIPTWSGASRATFVNLASELGTSVPIGPIVAKKSRVSLGKASAAGSGVKEVNNSKDVYVGFVYQTDLRYLAYNEYNIATAGTPPAPYSNNVRFTPYNFQKRAQGMWEYFASQAKLPDPYRYLEDRKL